MGWIVASVSEFVGNHREFVAFRDEPTGIAACREPQVVLDNCTIVPPAEGPRVINPDRCAQLEASWDGVFARRCGVSAIGSQASYGQLSSSGRPSLVRAVDVAHGHAVLRSASAKALQHALPLRWASNVTVGKGGGTDTAHVHVVWRAPMPWDVTLRQLCAVAGCNVDEARLVFPPPLADSGDPDGLAGEGLHHGEREWHGTAPANQEEVHVIVFPPDFPTNVFEDFVALLSTPEVSHVRMHGVWTVSALATAVHSSAEDETDWASSLRRAFANGENGEQQPPAEVLTVITVIDTDPRHERGDSTGVNVHMASLDNLVHQWAPVNARCDARFPWHANVVRWTHWSTLSAWWQPCASVADACRWVSSGARVVSRRRRALWRGASCAATSGHHTAARRVLVCLPFAAASGPRCDFCTRDGQGA